MLGFITGLILVVFVLLVVVSCIKIVPQARAYVVERLGGYQATWGVGIHFKVPFIDRIANVLGLQLYVRHPKVIENGEEVQCFEYFVEYKGYEFFEFTKHCKNYENVKVKEAKS